MDFGMQEITPRILSEKLISALRHMPAVALLGPRQVGKTTLALDITEKRIAKPVVYLDLELESDLAKLQNAEGYLKLHENQLLIIDEIQLKPDLFNTLRSLIDMRKRAGEPSAQFLLLGSASRDLLQYSSESLAGRIRYLELTPFSIKELTLHKPEEFQMNQLWFRGGFPQSYLAENDSESWNWRTDFISSYVERDIPQLGMNISATRMRRFWSMLAHFHGQQINYSSLAKSLEVSHTTIKNYLDILTDLYMVRQVQPWFGNSKKRLIKSPKVYIRDTGLLHRLLGISTFEELLGHPVMGHSWEGFVIENILNLLPDTWQASYYRTSDQYEIDLILEKSNSERWAIEIKHSPAPRVSAGFHKSSEDTHATRKIVLHSGQDSFPLNHDTEAMGTESFLGIL